MPIMNTIIQVLITWMYINISGIKNDEGDYGEMIWWYAMLMTMTVVAVIDCRSVIIYILL